MMTTPFVLLCAFLLLSSRGPKGRGDLMVHCVEQDEISTIYSKQACIAVTRCAVLPGFVVQIVGWAPDGSRAEGRIFLKASAVVLWGFVGRSLSRSLAFRHAPIALDSFLSHWQCCFTCDMSLSGHKKWKTVKNWEGFKRITETNSHIIYSCTFLNEIFCTWVIYHGIEVESYHHVTYS